MDILNAKNPDRHTCAECDRQFIALDPNTFNGDVLCTLCGVDTLDTWEEDETDEYPA